MFHNATLFRLFINSIFSPQLAFKSWMLISLNIAHGIYLYYIVTQVILWLSLANMWLKLAWRCCWRWLGPTRRRVLERPAPPRSRVPPPPCRACRRSPARQRWPVWLWSEEELFPSIEASPGPFLLFPSDVPSRSLRRRRRRAESLLQGPAKVDNLRFLSRSWRAVEDCESFHHCNLQHRHCHSLRFCFWLTEKCLSSKLKFWEVTEVHHHHS